MAVRKPLVIVSGQFSELPVGDSLSTVELAAAPSGLIYVGNKLGIDGSAQISGNAGISAGVTAQASGNAALVVGTTALASGNAALVVGTSALASGNAALVGLSNKYDKTGGVISGTVIVNKQSFGTINTIVSSGVLLVDFSTGNNFEVTLASNATFAGPVNASGGQSGAIMIRQDNTGSRTLAYSGSWAFQGGTAPTLTTAASGIDALAYYVVSPTRVLGILTAAYSGGSQ
jgi:hypothetical protein